MLADVRDESEIFSELAALCASPGYVHALAYLCFQNNVIRFDKKLTAEDLAQQYDGSHLIRTELATLVGLVARQRIDDTLPPPDVVEQYIERTRALLEELHHTMMSVWFAGLDLKSTPSEVPDPFATAAGMREPIFYGAESAYNFQYCDLALLRYSADDAWLETNRAFSIRDAVSIARALAEIQSKRQLSTVSEMKWRAPEDFTLLPAFEFSIEEVSRHTNIQLERVRSVLDSFSMPLDCENPTFNAINDFNVTNAKPIIARPSGKYLLLQHYSLASSIYESPLFWMREDSKYLNVASENRGNFTEYFVAQRLRLVFPEASVLTNVNIINPDGSNFGEIDVLVLYGDRAIVVQAKSKTLTIEARKGNDLLLKSDFKKAVQDSCDQAFSCARALFDPSLHFIDSDGDLVQVPRELRAILPICVVSDHYPALALQARQFLEYEESERIVSPLVTDVFAVDVMTEMLSSPLHFLHYLHLRAQFGEKFMAGNELALLGYHLKSNLWGDGDVNLMMIHDDVASDLDVAMLSRRAGAPGRKTPEGILTRYRGTAFGNLIEEIEQSADPQTTDLGIWLLSLNEGAAMDLGKGILKQAEMSRQDGGRRRDLTVATADPACGLTVHCSSASESEAGRDLIHHAELRKYSQKADSWYALLIDPYDVRIRLGARSDGPWRQDDLMDEATKQMPEPITTHAFRAAVGKRYKVGRNAPCPCGSGKKYKKCCL